jgi:copper chaperone
MCGCATHQKQATVQPADVTCGALTLMVEDMTCGYCASTIEKAIAAALPGTIVDANPVSKLVSIHGSTDRARIEAAVSNAGYTPSHYTLHADPLG